MSISANQMTPGASPGSISKKVGGRFLNNRPVYIVAGVAGAFLLVMMLVAADRAEKQNTPRQEAAEQAGNAAMFAQDIIGNQESGIIAPAAPPSLPYFPVADNPATDAAATPALVAGPPNTNAPPPYINPRPPLDDSDADRIRMMKLQMLQEAARAKTSIRIDAPRSGGSIGMASDTPLTRDEMLARIASVRQQINAQQATDPAAAYQARLAQIRASSIGGQVAENGGFTSPFLQAPEGPSNNYAQFGPLGGEDRWQLNNRPEAPRSPYELRAGFVVPATLISGINSDLPGQIMAQVAQNVYDTPTGRHLLIPQGARLVGSYSNDVAYGQQRVLVAWQRIVFPDGKAMDIGAMPGADNSGYAGFNDQVNNHYLRIFGSAFLMSGIVAAVSMSQNNSSATGNQQRASDALSEALGQVMGNTIAQIVSKNLNIAPTLEIRPGYRFNVIVTKDMTFSKPYRSFDY